MVTVRWWFEQSRSNAATCLKAAIVGSTAELGSIVYWGPSAYLSLPGPTKVTLKVWAAARKRFIRPHQHSPFSSLWGNPSLPHFRTIPGLRYIGLRSSTMLSNWGHCFPSILAKETLKKTLSALYLALLGGDSPKINALWGQWQDDIPNLDRETWEVCFEEGSRLMVSSRDKLLQTKCMHRIYYTPQRLHRIYPHRSPNCPRCQSPDSTYIHMFWTCPHVVTFWAAVFESINIRLQLTLLIVPELALLAFMRMTRDLVTQSYLFHYCYSIPKKKS